MSAPVSATLRPFCPVVAAAELEVRERILPVVDPFAVSVSGVCVVAVDQFQEMLLLRLSLSVSAVVAAVI